MPISVAYRGRECHCEVRENAGSQTTKSMIDFKIHWNQNGGDGSGFIELLPGRDTGKWWNHESAYIDENDFDEALSPVFFRHAPDFDFYGTTTIESDACWAIIDDLKATGNASANELAVWLHGVVARTGCLTVLGI